MKPTSWLIAASVALVPLVGAAAPSRNFDAFVDSATVRELPAPSRPLARLATVAHVERRLGVATFLWGVHPGAATTALLGNLEGLRPEQAARRHLFEHAELYRLRAEDVAAARVRAVHDTGSGGIIVSFRQQAEGLEVFRVEIAVLMNRKLELVAISGHLSPGAMAQKHYARRFALTVQTAAAVAFQDLTGLPLDPESLEPPKAAEGGYSRYALRAPAQQKLPVAPLIPLRTKSVLFELPEGLEPAHYVELNVGRSKSAESLYFSYVVSAVDGRVLFRNDLTHHAAYGYRVWADPGAFVPYNGPQGDLGAPHPTGVPDSYQAPFVAPSLVTLEHAGISTNDPWLPAAATTTAGNNVDAYDDLAGPDGFSAGDVRATVTTPNAFDYTYDVTLAPGANHNQHQAAVVGIFYVNNFLHDWYYDLGFDESSGNAQKSNFGRGGLSNDVLLAEGQDYSGVDNASMQIPPDGANPRMQMHVFTGKGTRQLAVLSPPAVAGQKDFISADFGPAGFDVTADLALVDDGTAPVTDACQPLSTGALAGKVALINRGTCTFSEKVAAAQAAGAVGAIIANNTGGGPMTLAGSDPSIAIPSQSVSQTVGSALAAQLTAGATVTVHLLSAAGVDRDGTLDNDIIAHEWGHYISNRLIGDANGLSNLQGNELGEGWGDFHSMLMAVRESDAQLASNANWSGVFGMATYTSSGGGNEGYYFGIRRVPYSTDFAKNALTFKHIQDGVALPTTHPVAFGANGSQNTEVHAAGEVWATMLWECYAALLRASPRLTFAQASERMRAYLVASYKLTPDAPTFLEARDALLAAAYAADLADFSAFAKAFARRGAGVGALAPDRDSRDNAGLKESFVDGGDLTFVSATLDDSVSSCDQDGVLDNTETGLLTVTLRNSGTRALVSTMVTVSTGNSSLAIADGGKLTFGSSQPFAAMVGKLQVSLSGLSGTQKVPITISFTDPGMAAPRLQIATFAPRLNYDLSPTSVTFDDVEAPATRWAVGFDPRLDIASPFRRVEEANEMHWFVPNPTSPQDQYLISPTLQVAPGGNFVIRFRHRFSFEKDSSGDFYDGGVVEIRTGGAWVDIGSKAAPGYPGKLVNGTTYGGQFFPSSNPLRDRQAFVGESPGYPEYVTTTIDLGATYAGSNVEVRFRMGADEAAGAVGWDIDDISFSGLRNKPFDHIVPGHATCGNQPPVASAGSDFSVDEGATVTLPGSATDPEGDSLTIAWSQTAGPAMTLANTATAAPWFTAPQVTADLLLTFLLTVGDGLETTSSSVTVQVKNVNRRPTAVVGTDQRVDEGAEVTLSGVGSADPDEGPVTFQWTQTSGPDVEIAVADSLNPVFTAPQVTEETQLTFSLVVSDGVAASDPASVTVTVNDLGNNAPAPSGCGCAAGGSPASALPYAIALAGLAALRVRRKAPRKSHRAVLATH